MFSARGGERQLCLYKGELGVSYFQTGTRTWSQDGWIGLAKWQLYGSSGQKNGVKSQ